MGPRFLCVTSGVRELFLRPTTSEVAKFSVCGMFVDY